MGKYAIMVKGIVRYEGQYMLGARTMATGTFTPRCHSPGKKLHQIIGALEIS